MLYCAFLDNRIFISTRGYIARHYDFVEAFFGVVAYPAYHFFENIHLRINWVAKIKREKRKMGDFNPMQISNLSISLLAVYSF